MDLEQLSILVALLAAISVAAERLVEIVKNLFPQLREGTSQALPEPLRNAALHVLAVLASLFTVFLVWPAVKAVLPPAWNTWWGIVVVGLLGSGGSGFWNSFATYVTNVKDLKKQEAQKQHAETELVNEELHMRQLEHQTAAGVPEGDRAG